MVYINSRGEVVDDTQSTPVNIFWKVINFFVLFFKSLVGIEDRIDKRDDDRSRGTRPTGSAGGGNGFSGGGGNSKPNDDNRPRKFGPRGFKSITDLTPPPAPPMMGGCSGGACG